jgi:hypothetical protein
VAVFAIEGYEATLDHTRLLQGKRQVLAAAQREAEEQHLHRISTAYAAGYLTVEELVAIYFDYRVVADQGFSHRWDAAIPVTAKQLVALARRMTYHQPNGPAGTWEGPYPFDDGTTPGDATSVTYVLFDRLGQCCYIGSTGHFRSRLHQHARDGKAFTYWHAYPCTSRAEAYRLEAQLVQQHAPYLNKTRCG